MTIEQLFFELIRVSIGTQDTLSCAPSAEEWNQLYEMAKKQSLIGICFAGVQRLNSLSPSLLSQLPEVNYLRWMGMAAKIQQRNEVVNRQCVELQERLAADGFRSCILKGQGVAQLYGKQLCGLRQSGDIDIYVRGGIKKVLGYCNEKFGKVEWDYINAHAPFYQDTEVEMHWRAQALTNLCANKRLQKWFASHESSILGGKVVMRDEKIVVPTIEFNAFYILLHCYHHMFESGLGLRQLMDYYFVLIKYAKQDSLQTDCEFDVTALFSSFGMKKFATGIMWIMKEVFRLPDEKIICNASEKEGRFLLDEVMHNGNFGHHDERVKNVGTGKMQFLFGNVQHNLHLATHYPSELFWVPVWLVYHYFWKRTNKNKI